MIQIRKVGSESIPRIKALADRTWPVAYGSILSPDQMRYMLDLIYSTASLEKQIEQLHHQFILALDTSMPCGFASYSPLEVSLRENEMINADKNIYRLHKLYIDPAHQGKGIGKFLLDFINSDIKQKGATDLELNVNRHNKALDFYQKAGFVIIREEDIAIGNGYFMNDFVMNLSI